MRTGVLIIDVMSMALTLNNHLVSATARRLMMASVGSTLVCTSSATGKIKAQRELVCE
jgi:hypothetical protein